MLNSNVKSVLLYEQETSRTTKTILSRLQRFINYWFDKVRNEDKWKRAEQESTDFQIKKRKWVNDRPLTTKNNNQHFKAGTWTPQGKQKQSTTKKNLA